LMIITHHTHTVRDYARLQCMRQSAPKLHPPPYNMVVLQVPASRDGAVASVSSGAAFDV
jgi:hypothetical protein